MAGSVIDKKVVLPELPDRHFYHFGKDVDGDITCEIRVGFTRWFSRKLESTYCSPSRFNESKMVDMAEELKMRFDLKQVREDLLGSYPPKTLRK